jgi:hypothetical protein
MMESVGEDGKSGGQAGCEDQKQKQKQKASQSQEKGRKGEEREGVRESMGALHRRDRTDGGARYAG